MAHKFEDFEQFLSDLVNRHSPNYDASWRLFDNEFTPKIVRQIERFTRNQQYVGQVFSDLYDRLIANDFKAIKRLRNRNERAFTFYLTQAARRLTISLLKQEKRFVTWESDVPVNEAAPAPTKQMVLDRAYYEALHRSFVKRIRTMFGTAKNQYNIERKLLAATLRYIAEFPSKAVFEISLLGFTEEHNVDVTIARFNKKIREIAPEVRDFPEKWLYTGKDLTERSEMKNEKISKKNLVTKNQSSIHLMPGAILALSKFGNNEHSEANEHIKECKKCGALYEFIGDAFKNDVKVDMEAAPQCPGTDKETALYIAKFLNKKTDVLEKHALRYFKHLNDCYLCFELFCVNWSSYWSVFNAEEVDHVQK